MKGRHVFECIDAHTCGNPVRLVKTGIPPLTGKDMREKRQHFLSGFDWIRKALMFEPRGHDMMSGSMLFPPHDPANDVAVLFIETSGCLPMCGHGLIGTVTIGVEEGLVKPKTPGMLRVETPAGLVEVSFNQENSKVTSVRLTNVWSFLHTEGLQIAVPELGRLKVDVSYGGNFYAIVEVQENFPGIEKFTASQLVHFSPLVRQAVNAAGSFQHPEDARISGCSHVLWAGASQGAGAHARNAVFYGDKAIDRSPCGTGTSARMAQWFAKGKLRAGDTFIHESIIGSRFTGRIEETRKLGPYAAIRPSIEGWARVTGYNTIIVEEADPYALGFQVI